MNNFTLPAYRNLIETALENNFKFIGYDEIDRETSDRTCLLRHDIDIELWGCLPINELEKDLNVKSTYFIMLRSTAYNLLCLESRSIIEKIQLAGHHLGLHFMTEICKNDNKLVDQIKKI